tara:strand:- start:433529 stop:434992 length:1464 start_codon:yes stop_codon:yes gene_type:complete
MANLLNNLKTKQPWWCTALLGAVAATGFAPLYLWPLTVFCLGVLFYNAFNLPQTAKRAFLAKAFWFYFGFSVGALWWVGGSFRYTDAGNLGLIAAPFAVAGIAAGLSLYVLPALYGAWRLWPKTPLMLRPPLVAAAWVLVEVLRSLSVYGFPWHLVGYTLAGDDYILQAASVGGVWLLSVLVLLPAAAYAARPKLSFMLFWILPLCIAYSGGMVRLANKPAINAEQNMHKVQLIQPNTDQSQKWQISGVVTAQKVLNTLKENDAPETLTVFPEVAVTLLLNNIPTFPTYVGNYLEAGSAAVIGIPHEAMQNGQMVYLNGMVAINAAGQQVDMFDKQLLVPFGEFVPLRDYLPSFIKQLAQGGDYRGGIGPRVLNLGDFGQALPLICYESAFPYVALKAANDHQPNMIINLTNDGWFDGTTGGYQHFAIAKVRSVETGLPQLRVANTGITALIDGYGTVQSSTKMRHMSQLNDFIPIQSDTFLKNMLK